MDHGYGIQAPGEHVPAIHLGHPRWLVIIESAGSSVARWYLGNRELVTEVLAGSEEVASMTQGLAPEKTAHLAEWDAALAGDSREAREAADVYTLPA